MVHQHIDAPRPADLLSASFHHSPPCQAKMPGGGKCIFKIAVSPTLEHKTAWKDIHINENFLISFPCLKTSPPTSSYVPKLSPAMIAGSSSLCKVRYSCCLKGIKSWRSIYDSFSSAVQYIVSHAHIQLLILLYPLLSSTSFISFTW